MKCFITYSEIIYYSTQELYDRMYNTENINFDIKVIHFIISNYIT